MKSPADNCSDHKRACQPLDDLGLPDLEYQLTAAILAGLPCSVAVARSEGFEPDLIIQDDLRTICRVAVFVTDRGGSDSDVIGVATMALIHFQQWGAWTPESLAAFAAIHAGQPSPVRELARALVDMHAGWANAASEHGPLYCAPPQLRQLPPVRLGLALAKLARLSGIPCDWLHFRFAQICRERDTKTRRRGAA